jgi:hypothetical protein
MVWPDQNPPASDVLLHVNVPCAGGSPAYLEIDKLCGPAECKDDGRYRATVGTLFEHQEICRTRDLEALVRQANAMAGCRSFDDCARHPGDAGVLAPGDQGQPGADGEVQHERREPERSECVQRVQQVVHAGEDTGRG